MTITIGNSSSEAWGSEESNCGQNVDARVSTCLYIFDIYAQGISRPLSSLTVFSSRIF